jgi:hypothetical protein
MNQREKILAIVVGLLAVAAGLYFGSNRVMNLFATRTERMTELEEEIARKEAVIRRGAEARRLLDVFEERSLPSQPELASSRYRAWLLAWTKRAQIDAANVQHVMVRRHKDSYDRHTLQVQCQATLAQIVRLLHEFYSTDYLHRINVMSVKPLEGRTLSLAFTIEAVAMPQAPKDRELGELPADRLMLSRVEDYLESIVSRDFTAPAKKPAKIAYASTQKAVVNQRLSISPKMENPDDTLISFRLDDHDLNGISIDENTGRIEWTPDRTGEFEILVRAEDDGYPPQETSQTVTVIVTDPPPVEAPPPPRPRFDEARHTFVTGIVEVNGQREVWIHVRTDGRWLKLVEGDSFNVGSFRGTIVAIHPRHVEIQAGTTRVSVRNGQSLNAGEVLTQAADDVVSSTQ